jgi:hypothetical protein
MRILTHHQGIPSGSAAPSQSYPCQKDPRRRSQCLRCVSCAQSDRAMSLSRLHPFRGEQRIEEMREHVSLLSLVSLATLAHDFLGIGHFIGVFILSVTSVTTVTMPVAQGLFVSRFVSLVTFTRPPIRSATRATTSRGIALPTFGGIHATMGIPSHDGAKPICFGNPARSESDRLGDRCAP